VCNTLSLHDALPIYEYIELLKKERPKLILCGDYNICHKAIDIHDPKGNKDASGFLPEEREWMEKLFTSGGMVDSFRAINQAPHQYTWWSYRANARANNKGWRIDYVAVTENLQTAIKHAAILPDAKHSDHCPMVVEMDI
jgi:exodeoxyribonuclease-3